jgi:amino acid adenylation domain-containing protein
LVAVCLERTPELVVTLLAVMATGAAYVPLDPSYPRERLAFMLEDSGAALLVADAAGHELARPGVTVVAPGEGEKPATEPATNRRRAAPGPGQTAYVIYTSGSTGRPKGVQVLHGGLANFLRSLQREPGISAADTLLAVTTVSFDIAALELWLPLVTGARVVLVDRATAADGAALLAVLHASGASILQATPVTWRMLLAAGWTRSPGLRVFCGGEVLPGDLAAELLRRSAEVWNLYGPTETTIWSTVHRVRPADTTAAAVTIGRPIANTQCHVLDARLQPVPVGVPGELHVGGEGVARGYWGRAGLTAERFVPDPFSAIPGARLYRTGDQARWRGDGTLEYLGRRDQQVKLRGYRIELGEIEAAVAEHPAVAAAVVALRRDRAGDERLVGYVVRRDGGAAAAEQPAWTRELTGQWQSSWDETYRDPGDDGSDGTHDFAGWNSSYTGAPIPAIEMREWLDDTVQRLRALRPRRVLELGCGTGLLLLRLAAETEQYWAVDFSRVALERLRRQAAARGWSHVRLLEREAADLADLPTGAFDTVILNSVVQYFPHPDHLRRVIAGALTALAPGGALFIGDVRSLPLLRHQHASVQFARAADALTRAELRARVQTAMAREEELVLDPAFFIACRGRFPGIGSVEIALKLATAENELSRFRYDVTLRVGESAVSHPEVEWQPIGEAVTLDEIRERLRGARGEVVGWRELVNSRLHLESRLLAWLDRADAAGTVGDLRRSVSSGGEVTPGALSALAAASGWTLTLTWSPGADEGQFDAVFSRGSGRPSMPLVDEPLNPRPWGDYATNPLRARLAARLGPALTTHVATRLPAYMVPSAWVLLEAMPLTANGKVDRRALPAPDAGAPKAVGYVAPRDELESALAAIWTTVLGGPRVGVLDSFFDLGGHSLTATQLVARVRRELGVEISIVDVFQQPTVAALATVLRAAARRAPDLPPAAAGAGPVPLSAAQRRLWIIEQMRPGTAAYNMAEALRLEGPLAPVALRAALAALVDRHETLRTVFEEQGDDVFARVGPPAATGLTEHDVSATADPEAAAHALAAAEAVRPFDLRTGPLVRATLIRLGPQSHVLVCVMHHIVTDALSQRVLLREFAALYAAHRDGRPSPLPALPATYREFARWQATELAGPIGAEQRAYWRQKLGGGLQALALPLDAPRPAMMTAEGRTVVFTFEPALGVALVQMGRAAGATPFMTLLALVKALLHRYTGQEEIVIGSPVAGRERVEWEEAVGFFVNTLALRDRVTRRESFAVLLARVRATCLEAYAHQSYPFDRLVDDLRLERDLSRNPLYDVSVQLLAADGPDTAFADLRMTDYDHGQAPAKCDLSFDFREGPGGLSCGLTYCAALFGAAKMGRLVKHLRRLAAAVVADPARALGEHDLLAPEERRRLLVEFNPVAGVPVRDTVPGWFSRVAALRPGHVALRAGTEVWTYGELEARSDRLAHALRARGVGREAVVAVLAERDPAMVLAALAVMKAGGIYLPVDPVLPEARITWIIRDAGAVLVVGSRTNAARAPAGVPVLVPEETASDVAPTTTLEAGPVPEQGAYLIYTSGSTGTPKGVLVEHRGIVNTVADQILQLQISAHDRVLQFASPSFDASCIELFCTLLGGATLVLARPESLLDPQAFVALLRTQAVTVVTVPPSFLRSLERAELPLRLLMTAGEAAMPDDARHYARSLTFVNGYGPTEASVCSAVHVVAGDEPTPFGVPIGRPLANTRAYVVDEYCQPVPVGVAGELCVAGAGLARGYWGRPDLTAGCFVPDPLAGGPGGRMYRTGDLARWREDGVLEFLGRADTQVKLRGYRIELGEVEAALRRVPGVREAVVLRREDRPGQAMLVGYVVGADAARAPTAEALAAALRTELPDYMVPAVFVVLAEFPLSVAGKINRRALPAPSLESQDADHVAPRDEVEQAVAEIFRTVLRVERVGAHDRFFHLGGNSLLAMQVISRVRDRFKVTLSVADFFSQASVAGLAGLLRADPASRTQVEQVARAAARLAVLSPAEKQALLARKRAAGGPIHG